MKITNEGRPHLGTPLGSKEFRKQFVDSKVKEWCENVCCLTDIAHMQHMLLSPMAL